jgi:hypothetical protein
MFESPGIATENGASSEPEGAENESVNVEHYVPLATRCTLGVGGAARFFVRAQDEKNLVEALEWADQGGVVVRVLGGGSNVVIAKVAINGAGSAGSSAGPSNSFRQGPAFSRIDNAAKSTSALST